MLSRLNFDMEPSIGLCTAVITVHGGAPLRAEPKGPRVLIIPPGECKRTTASALTCPGCHLALTSLTPPWCCEQSGHRFCLTCWGNMPANPELSASSSFEFRDIGCPAAGCHGTLPCRQSLAVRAARFECPVCALFRHGREFLACPAGHRFCARCWRAHRRATRLCLSLPPPPETVVCMAYACSQVLDTRLLPLLSGGEEDSDDDDSDCP